jgi:hypothetical protein
MESFTVETIDLQKLTEDFDYFIKVYNWVDETNHIPIEINREYQEGFRKFSDRLPVMNQPIPQWNPEAKPMKFGLQGMFQNISDLFA